MTAQAWCAVRDCPRTAVADMETKVLIPGTGAQTIKFAICATHGGKV